MAKVKNEYTLVLLYNGYEGVEGYRLVQFGVIRNNTEIDSGNEGHRGWGLYIPLDEFEIMDESTGKMLGADDLEVYGTYRHEKSAWRAAARFAKKLSSTDLINYDDDEEYYDDED